MVVPQLVGAIGATVLGDRLAEAHDDRIKDADIKRLEALGLTPTEIAGAGAGAGGAAASGGNVLGNQAGSMTLQRQQQKFENEQRDKDRAVILQGQQTGLAQAQLSAQATLGAAAQSAGASRYGTDASERLGMARIALEEDRFRNVDLPESLNRQVTNAPAWERQRIMAQMGVDNIIGTAIANKYGLNPMDADALKGMSETQFNAMVRDIYGLQSNVFSEASGGKILLEESAGTGGRTVLGNSRPRTMGERIIDLYR